MTTRADAHRPEFHRNAAVAKSVRCATTANGTLASAYENGDTVDGVTLATGDRILLKDQTTGSQNGIYVVAASGSPARAYDMDDSAEVRGVLVYVEEGTTNGATLWANTNTGTVTLGTTALTFAKKAPGTASVTFGTPALTLGTSNSAGSTDESIRRDATILAFDATSPSTQAFGDSAAVGTATVAARRDHKHAMPTAAVTTSGLTQATGKLLGRSTASTGAIEEITVGTGLSLSAGSLSATGGGGGSLEVAEADGTPDVTGVTKIVVTNGTLTDDGSGQVTLDLSGGGGGGSSDAILGQSGVGGARISGLQASADIDVAGTNDDEFNTTDTSDPMSGWTTLGTPTAHDINSTAKSHYHVRQAATATLGLVGIYKAIPTTPFTVTCKVTDALLVTKFNLFGLFTAEASPGKIEQLEIIKTDAGVGYGVDAYTNRTTFGSTPVAFVAGYDTPLYLRCAVTTTTNIAWYISRGGQVWRPLVTGRNPGFTVGSVGVSVAAQSSSSDGEAIFDWIRFT